MTSFCHRSTSPASITSSDLDRWARDIPMRTGYTYVAALAAESPHGAAKAREWLASSDTTLRVAGWHVVGYLASIDEKSPDDWYAGLLAQIEKSIHSVPNDERDSMNNAVIAIGGRSAALRKSATGAARRIGKVEIDQGDTSCKTRDALAYIEKTWAHASAQKFASPAAQERARERMRTRCQPAVAKASACVAVGGRKPPDQMRMTTASGFAVS